MLIEFESAVLSPRVGEQSSPIRIGWFVQAIDVDSASIRYRCFHFARVLAPQFSSLYFTSVAELRKALPGLDLIVIVKRIDGAVVDIVGMVHQSGVPVFLDLCDDLIAPGYPKNHFGKNLIHFLGIAPLLAGITVPSAEMANRLSSYASDNGLRDVSIHVVPDIAETWDIYRDTFRFVSGTEPRSVETRTPAMPRRPEQVLWFGNFGSGHSDFGIFSLKPAMRALAEVHTEIPLELIVVSNSEPVYRALVQDCGFPTRYVEWSAAGVYSELAEADVALLTTGDDDFCTIKSSNRVLQSLAAGVPVISPKHASLSEFEDAIFSGKLSDALRLSLGPVRKRTVPPKMTTARRLLERYSPERIGRIWSTLLKQAVRPETGKRPNSQRKVLIVFEPGDSLKAAKASLTAAKAIPSLEYELLVSIDLLRSQPEFMSLPGRGRRPPRFFGAELKGARNVLLDCAALVVERPSAPVATVLAGHARELGVALITAESAASGALENFGQPKADLAPSPSRITAGPNRERLNPDGTVDWAFIVHENARGWILDAISREIGSRQSQSWRVVYHPEPSPPAKYLFFSHYLLLENYIEKHPEKLKNTKVFVWYTHPREEDPVSIARRLLTFDHVTKVIFTCEANRRVWIERGLPEDKAMVILGAADPNLFRFHERGAGVVGLSSSFYERKNPDCLLEVVKLLSQRQFLLLGRNWHQYALFEEMKALPNFEYRSAPYKEYPRLYSTFDVFLSMSNLEGGPIPLIEAMMSNAVPVASKTGFAPDLIRHGENGFIFDLDASPQEIAEFIEAAFALRGDVRSTVEQYDWQSFSSSVVKLAQ
jgi:glycosyltransferase involved in cell wall biosynthesis